MAIIRQLGLQDYESIWRNMQNFTINRNTDTSDELWLVEHPAVYTLGLNGNRQHLLNTGDIPVIQCDRGGQVTYHAPGQVVLYTLLDINRLKLNIRELVTLLEQTLINVLNDHGITAVSKAEAPGVYVANKKIGSVGLRIKKNCSYHGLSLNNHMDLQPFDRINTCGYPNLKVTQLADFGVIIKTEVLATQVAHTLLAALPT